MFPGDSCSPPDYIISRQFTFLGTLSLDPDYFTLPKIHEDPSKWSKPGEMPPGRLIVSNCSRETYYTAEFYLNPLSTKHASYIKETYDFVEKAKQTHNPVNSFLFTIVYTLIYT